MQLIQIPFSSFQNIQHTKGMFPEGRGPKPRCIPKVNHHMKTHPFSYTFLGDMLKTEINLQ
jgi:hypothetical protein